jgi:hypothetical protein
MNVSPSIRERLFSRLRQRPLGSSVPQSLPVLFFGDLFRAHVATVGLNPSHQEYMNRHGVELDGAARRFETLTSLGAAARSSLTDEQCDRAIQTMRMYYRPGKPVYSWFRSLDRVARAMGFKYEEGQVSHLDLAQEATHPAWSALSKAVPADFGALRLADLPFLRWQLETFPLDVVICNGRTVLAEVCQLVGGQISNEGKVERIRWFVGTSTLNARRVILAGWNIPLARATGLGSAGEQELGRILRSHITRLRTGERIPL